MTQQRWRDGGRTRESVAGTDLKATALDNQEGSSLVVAEATMLTMAWRVARRKSVTGDVPQALNAMAIWRILFGHTESDRQSCCWLQANRLECVAGINGVTPGLD